MNDAEAEAEYARLFSPSVGSDTDMDEMLHAEEYSGVYLKYLQKYFLFFWASCSMFFFFSFYLTAAYRIEEGYK